MPSPPCLGWRPAWHAQMTLEIRKRIQEILNRELFLYHLQAKLPKGVELMEQLLSKDITHCFPQVCEILAEDLGSSWKTGITIPFFMFLENGCTKHLPQSSSNKIEKWCNFLLYEIENSNATVMVKKQAQRIFNEVKQYRHILEIFSVLSDGVHCWRCLWVLWKLKLW